MLWTLHLCITNFSWRLTDMSRKKQQNFITKKKKKIKKKTFKFVTFSIGQQQMQDNPSWSVSIQQYN